jgi:hypothetical protein
MCSDPGVSGLEHDSRFGYLTDMTNYCRPCASFKGVKIFSRRGYPDIYRLGDTMRSWKSEGRKADYSAGYSDTDDDMIIPANLRIYHGGQIVLR